MIARRARRLLHSVRVRLLLLAILAVTPITVLIAYHGAQSRHAAIEEAKAQLSAEARLVADGVHKSIAGTLQLLDGLSHAPELVADASRCSALLTGVHARQPQFTSMIVFDREGDVICNALVGAKPSDVRGRDFYGRALALNAPVVSAPTYGRITGKPVIVVVHPLPGAAAPGGRFIAAVLSLEHSLAAAASIQRHPSARIVVWDSKGLPVARVPDPEKVAGKSVSPAQLELILGTSGTGTRGATIGLDGTYRVYAVARLPQPIDGDARVSVSVPQSVITEHAERAYWTLLTASGAILVAALALAWLLGERGVQRPVIRLVQAATKLGEGDLAFRLGPPYPPSELGDLMAAWDRSTEILQAQRVEILERDDALQRANRALHTLIECNQALVHSDDERSLLHAVCERIVARGGYRFAWVGYAGDNAEQTVHLVARAGDDDGYLDGVWIRWSDDARAEEPTAAAIRSGRPVNITNIANEPAHAAWRDAALARGYVSCLALPLAEGVRVLGALCIYSAEPNRFHDEETALLTELAADVAFGIVALRNREQRKQAETKIRAQLEHLSLLDQITRSIGEHLDLKSILRVVLIRLEESLPVDFGVVCLYEAEAHSLQIADVGARSQALAQELGLQEHAAIGIDENGLARCVRGELVYEPELSQARFAFPERLARGGLGSLVLAPLKSESRVFGVLVAARRAGGGFSSTDCEFLRQLSEHVALAAHQAQLYSSLQEAYEELRRTQQTVMQEERLRALGQMASGIAHDINNALSPVSLYVESMLETERGLSQRARDYLRTVQRAVEDVAQTVARLREFYRQREVQLVLAPVQLNRLVQQVLDLTRARWSDMPQSRGVVIRTRTELASDLSQVMGVESEIREALTNVVFNAVDAMPEGGTLTLRTRLLDADGQHPAVAVEVTDTGSGMDEDTRKRCLEPFFTTKGERGTGLGLAMVFGMVQRHSAELQIDSAPGKGTTVRLIFAAPATVQTDSSEPAEPLAVPSRLRLLLIDDDPVLLKSLRDTLETDGHVVATASGGEAGISAFRAALPAEPFSTVITDLGMPYVDGRRVAAAVKEASPATPVILLTGWGRRLVAEGEIPAHVDRVLAKPPKLHEVRAALAELCRPATDCT